MNPIDQSEGSKALDQREHNRDASAKRVVLRYQDLNTGDWINYIPGQTTLTERYDYSGSPIYVGLASIGTADSSTGWSITAYDLSDSSDASGKVATDVSWDDRATGDYA